jgi:hypothetical protein
MSEEKGFSVEPGEFDPKDQAQGYSWPLKITVDRLDEKLGENRHRPEDTPLGKTIARVVNEYVDSLDDREVVGFEVINGQLHVHMTEPKQTFRMVLTAPDKSKKIVDVTIDPSLKFVVTSEIVGAAAPFTKYYGEATQPTAPWSMPAQNLYRTPGIIAVEGFPLEVPDQIRNIPTGWEMVSAEADFNNGTATIRLKSPTRVIYHILIDVRVPAIKDQMSVRNESNLTDQMLSEEGIKVWEFASVQRANISHYYTQYINAIQPKDQGAELRLVAEIDFPRHVVPVTLPDGWKSEAETHFSEGYAYVWLNTATQKAYHVKVDVLDHAFHSFTLLKDGDQPPEDPSDSEWQAVLKHLMKLGHNARVYFLQEQERRTR